MEGIQVSTWKRALFVFAISLHILSSSDCSNGQLYPDVVFLTDITCTPFLGEIVSAE
jgi:hypothetical protein